MKYLTLIRHAKSSWDDGPADDHERPLNERGLRCAPTVGRFLARTYLGANGTPALLPRPDQLVTSSALRAKQTADLVAAELKAPAPVPDHALYLAAPKGLLQAVREFADRWHHVMLFGHNPGISDFAAHLLKRHDIEEMPTCAVALLELPRDAWSSTAWDEARLIGYITPKLIEKRFAQEVGA